jgi:peptidoglycan/LPS O-acetylase OafA/YrhL
VLVPILTLPLGLSPDRQEIVFTAYGRILIGCLVALCLHERRIFRYLRRLGGTAWSAVVACAFVGALLLVDGRPGNLTLYAFPFVAGVFLVTIVVGSGGVAARVLSQPLVRRVGTRAYGMYLLDSIANRATGYLIHDPSGWPSTLASFVIRLALAFVLADILYRIVERPLIKVGKRLSGRLHAREAASIARVAPSGAG